MSANVSLGDTPGVSAYFDGQPIQDQQEAELRREEERQEKELRRLLEAELEDFEDDEDFLSGSNSEDDGGNQSLTSGHHSARSSVDFLSERDNDGGHPATASSLDPSILAHRDAHLKMGNSQSPAGARELTRVKGHQPFSNEAMGLPKPSMAADPKSPPGPHGHPLSVAGGDSQQVYAAQDYPQSNSLFPHHQNYSGGRGVELNPPNPAYMPGNRSPGHRPTEFFRAPGSQQNQQEDSLLSSYLAQDNPPQPESFAHFDYLTSQPVHNRGVDSASQDTASDHSNSDVLFGGNRGINAGELNVNVANSLVGTDIASHADDDEWMMKIQTATTPSQSQPHPHHHHQHHPHHQHLQSQQHLQPQHSANQQQPGYKYHHRVPMAMGAGLYTKSPQLPTSQATQMSSTFSPKYQHQQLYQHHHHHHQQQQPHHQLHQQQEQPHHQLQQQQRHQQEISDSPPPLPATLPPSLPPPKPSAVIPSAETQYKVVHNKQPMNISEEDPQYKVVYQNKKSLPNGEEEFYLSNDQTEFFQKDGPEEKQRYEQLEILYRARGREVEELKRKLEENEADAGREKRALKHRAAVAEGEATGTNESLKQSQRLLQQAKADNAEALGKISALEKELTAFRDTKEELIKKLTQAESTIETLTQHVTELSESDSVSRARREHEAVLSTLSQRHQREMLVIKEQLDVARAELSTKTQELSQVREQLGEATLALEQAQVSRGETVNRLSRSLEESQHRCQELLQQLGSDGAAREVTTLRVKLEQSQESTRISEELCRSYQNELKEAKEQLNMLEAATTLGAFSALSSAASASASGRGVQPVPSADDSMTDLGIRKTLDFNSTPQSEGRCEEPNQAPIDDDLVSSLRNELERCLRSNREKRAELTELKGRVKTLTSEMEKAKGQLSEFEKTCSDQKKRLIELGELVGVEENGVGAVEARLKRDLDKMVREKQALLDDIKDYQQRLEEVGASEARLTEINEELSQQMSAMVATGDQDKADALARCQRTMEETGRITLENMRREVEERHAAEVETLTSRGERQLADLKQQLSSTLAELDDVKALYVNVCQEAAAQEAELTEKFRQQLEAESRKIEDRVELEKKEWREFIRDEVKKEEEEGKKTGETEKLNQLEADLKAKWEEEVDLKVAETRLETLQEQRKLMSEERQDWERRQTDLEEKLKQRKEEISQLTSQLEEARSQTRALEDKLRRFEEIKVERKELVDSANPSSERITDEPAGLKEREGRYGVGDVDTPFDSSTRNAPSLMSITMASSQMENSTIMETLQPCNEETSSSMFGSSDASHKVERLSPGLGDQPVSANRESESLEEVRDVAVKLQESEHEVERLTQELKSKCLELEEKRKELEELQHKGRELEVTLEQKETELVEVQERLRQQEVESAQEVEEYRQRIVALEAEFEKAKTQMAQDKDDTAGVDEDGNQNNREERKREMEGSGLPETAGGLASKSDTHGLDNHTVEQLRELVRSLQEKFKLDKDSHKTELDRQRELHRVEFERAARQREEKFQSELRYFLKEREEKGKMRMEEAVRECREKCEGEFGKTLREREEKAREEFEASLRNVRRAHEEESRKLREDFEAKMEEEKLLRGRKINEVSDENAMYSRGQGLVDSGDSDNNNDSMESLKVKVASLTDELKTERQAKEKLKPLVEEKDGQIVAMALRHEEEEKALREKFDREIAELKEVYEKQVKRLAAELDVQRKKFEDLSKEVEISATAKTTVETLRVEAEVEKVRKEMEVEMERKLKEELKRRRSQEGSLEEEVEKRLREKLQEERDKWFKDAEGYIGSEVTRGVEERLREEQDKKKVEFAKEVEGKVKWRLEEECARLGRESEEKVEERVREKMEVEMANLKKKFAAELSARINMEKSRLEQEVAEWKTQARKEIERDREARTKELTAKMMEDKEQWMKEKRAQIDKRIAEEKKKLESELRSARDKEIMELRKELEGEMRKRIHREREEWEEDVKDEQQRRGEREKQGREEENEGVISMEDKLKSEVEARTKACAERDRAVTFIREREMSYKEERQRLLSGLERCRNDLEGMKEEHRELEEKCAAMDRRYKEDMKSARRRREEDLHNLRKTLDRERHEAVSAWEEKVRALREECGSAVERARSQGELEKASLLAEVQRRTERALDKSSLPLASDTDSSTILELRDHYLETVAKIKADVMSHVEEANSRAAATMRAQIRKQRVKVVEEFKVKVKACLKAALTGEVPASCILALEKSIDALSQQLLSVTSASSSSSSGNTPRSGHDSDRGKVTSDLGNFDIPGNPESSPHETAELVFQGEDRNGVGRKQIRGLSPKRVSPPKRDTDDVFKAFDNRRHEDGNSRQRHQRVRANAQSPSLQRLNAQAQRDFASKTPPVSHNTHPQLDGVDLFDTGNSQSQHTTPTAARTRSNVPRPGASPVRKSKLGEKSAKALHQQNHQQQQKQPSNVPSTVSTKGGDTTPASSNASSPRASPTPTHGGNKPLSGGGGGDLKLNLKHSPYVTEKRGSGGDEADWTPTRQPYRDPAAMSKKSSKDFETSPRDQMKMVEARVRLANWAKSGAAPWTSPVMIGEETDPAPEKAGATFGEAMAPEQRKFPWEEDADFEGKGEEFGGVISRDGFRVPGPEAEKWVRSQKRVGVKRTNRGERSHTHHQEPSNLGSYADPIHQFEKVRQSQSEREEIDRQERVGILKAVVMAEDQFLSSDESVASNNSHTSFVTLEPEEKTSGSGMFKQSLGERESRALGMAGSLKSQNPADSGLPRSTRTVNTSNGFGADRGISPYRKDGRSVVDEFEDGQSQDYERIRAAVLRGGGGLRDKIDLGIGDRDSVTSSDDEMSVDDFRTYPSKSAERPSRAKFTMPTSTPLVKHSAAETRPWSEGRAEFRRGKGHRAKVKADVERDTIVESQFERESQSSWRQLGGQAFFEPDRPAVSEGRDGRRDRRQKRDGSGGRPSPQKSGSLPQHSLRGKSHEHRRRGDELVLRSAEQFPLTSTAFPSDLSRITQASGKTDDSGPGMWRYRSLEDLISGRGTGADGGRLRLYRDSDELDELDGREGTGRSVEVKSNSRAKTGIYDVSLGSHSGSTDWYERVGSGGGPVQAMTSEFWERQRSDQDDLEDEEQEKERWNPGRRPRSSGKIQRSTSEQSLHTLHAAGKSGEDRVTEGVDALLEQYLSPSRSSFDLRPFAREEHF